MQFFQTFGLTCSLYFQSPLFYFANHLDAGQHPIKTQIELYVFTCKINHRVCHADFNHVHMYMHARKIASHI